MNTKNGHQREQEHFQSETVVVVVVKTVSGVAKCTLAKADL
jgi:hypothetical protein